jgi:acylglycerol lipase
MFHGLGSHMNQCAHVAKNLTDIGCIVVGFDHRGFGNSEGLSMYLENIQLHMEDSNKFIDMVMDLYKPNFSLPIFLSGLSMGGMTSFKLAI